MFTTGLHLCGGPKVAVNTKLFLVKTVHPIGELYDPAELKLVCIKATL